MILDEICGSPFWDSNLTWETDSPEFTPCFQVTALTWGPCLCLWILSPLEIYFVSQSKSAKIPKSWLNLGKMVAISGLVLLSVIDMGFVLKILTFDEVFDHSVDQYTPLVKFLTFILAGVLIFASKTRGKRTSGILFLFWLLLSLCGLPQYRASLAHIFNGHSPEPVYPLISYLIYYPIVLASLILNFVADLPSRTESFHSSCGQHPELAASFPSKMLFIWFEPLLWRGLRRPLEVKDLWPVEGEDSAHHVGPKFDRCWRREAFKHSTIEEAKTHYLKKSSSIQFKPQDRNSKVSGGQVSVLPVLCKKFGPAFIFGSSLKLGANVLALVSPQLLSSLINFVENRNEYVWHGYFYAIVLFATAFVQTILQAQYAHSIFDTGLKITTAIKSAIYRKSLRISNSSRQESTVGEIVNLMAVDAERFNETITSLVEMWSAPLQVALVVYFLSQLLGVSVLAGLSVMILMIPLNGLVAAKIRTLQIKQMKYKDKRIQLMNEVLSGVKVLKLYAWEGSFEKRILHTREKEIRALKKAAYLKAITSFISACAPFLVSLATFAVYVLMDENNILTVRTAFVSLSLFNILQDPLSELPIAFSDVIQVNVSLKRINKFMNLSELNTSAVTHNDFEDSNLVIEDGNLSWDGVNPVLQDITVHVRPSSLVAIVGPVGSGKSSLLAALLGEMEVTSGRINVRGSIAYVSQEAWIQNATLSDNILFGKQLNPQHYSKVVEACALSTDLDFLPAGDNTEIGEKGINLSGGQKQRVSMARAVYQDRDVYLLDDPLSAVDSHVGEHIFKNVIGPKGLLNKKTRVLVTHSISHLKDMDQIIVMKEGKISEIGTYNRLIEKQGAFREFFISHQQDVNASGVVISEIDLINDSQLTGGEEELSSRGGPSVSQLSVRSVSMQESNISEANGDVNKAVNGQKLIQTETAETGSVQWNVYFHYFRAMGWVLSLATITFVFVFQVLSIGANLWLSEWASDTRTTTTNTESVRRRNDYLEIYAVLGLGQAIASLLAAVSLAEGSLNATSILHFSLMKSILRAPTSFFDTTPIGRIVNRFSQDVDTVDAVLPTNLRLWQNCFFTVAGVLFVISFSTPMFLLIIIPVAFVYYLVQRFYVPTARQLKRLRSVTRSPIYSHFKESVTGASVIRAFGVQNRFISESEEKVDMNQVCYFLSLTSNRWLAVRLETLGNLIVLSAGLLSVFGRDTIGAGLVGLSISYAMTITRTLNSFVRLTSGLEANIVAVERMKEYTDTEQEAPWSIPERAPPSDWPEKGEIIFKDFKVRYRPGLDLVLKGITFSVKGGEKVGIVGRTGAGKSSITLSLFRIIEAAGGAIFIDNIDISALGLHDLRSRITIIPQDPVLFSGSVRFNLDPTGVHSDDSIWRALELSHLRNYVKSLSSGLQHEVAEGGENLSVGQRQLICLARALLRKTKVLILDEATASVDLDTDDLIQSTIRSEFKDCTVLTIAHRLNTILDSDRILVLDQGMVVEYDAPTKLVKNQNSLFFLMAKAAGLVKDTPS